MIGCNDYAVSEGDGTDVIDATADSDGYRRRRFVCLCAHARLFCCLRLLWIGASE